MLLAIMEREFFLFAREEQYFVDITEVQMLFGFLWSFQISFKIWILFCKSEFLIPIPPSFLGPAISFQLIVCFFWN